MVLCDGQVKGKRVDPDSLLHYCFSSFVIFLAACVSLLALNSIEAIAIAVAFLLLYDFIDGMEWTGRTDSGGL